MDTQKIEETIKQDAVIVKQKTIFIIGDLYLWAKTNPLKAIFLVGFVVGFILGTIF